MMDSYPSAWAQVWKLRDTDLGFEPGTQFSYSNVGYNVLQCVIQTVTASASAPRCATSSSRRSAWTRRGRDLLGPLPAPRRRAQVLERRRPPCAPSGTAGCCQPLSGQPGVRERRHDGRRPCEVPSHAASWRACRRRRGLPLLRVVREDGPSPRSVRGALRGNDSGLRRAGRAVGQDARPSTGHWRRGEPRVRGHHVRRPRGRRRGGPPLQQLRCRLDRDAVVPRHADRRGRRRRTACVADAQAAV